MSQLFCRRKFFATVHAWLRKLTCQNTEHLAHGSSCNRSATQKTSLLSMSSFKNQRHCYHLPGHASSLLQHGEHDEGLIIHNNCNHDIEMNDLQKFSASC